MKKMFFFLAAILTLTACGGSGEAPASDSTVVIDSVVPAIDSVNVVTDSAQLEDAAGASESAHEIPVK